MITDAGKPGSPGFLLNRLGHAEGFWLHENRQGRLIHTKLLLAVKSDPANALSEGRVISLKSLRPMLDRPYFSIKITAPIVIKTTAIIKAADHADTKFCILSLFFNLSVFIPCPIF